MKPFSVAMCILTAGFRLMPAQVTPAFVLYSPEEKPVITIDSSEAALIGISARLLAKDIECVTGFLPDVQSTQSEPAATGPVIIIGTLKSKAIRGMTENQRAMLCNQWEVYGFFFLQNLSGRYNTLIICGSDARGAAYGVFSLCEKIGVSPWMWWADVQPESRDTLALPARNFTSRRPSVKYRGIFLNDEDWGLQPWAARTFEPETGDIGPKTYAKIFELLLRLKANFIWPAMHSCTRAFSHYPENWEMAKEYQIVIGSSHAEPMLRNNVDEWNSKGHGEFNYQTNHEGVYSYWEDRVRECRDQEAVYTVGMRGIHDSGMEGFDHVDSRVEALHQIIMDQRRILSENIDPDITAIPQAFTPYKEVLDIYDHGLEVPEDITIVWTDDNYGYIRRLNRPEEMQRPGGSGVYYHLSYWGRPHDYLWLSSTHPVLVWEEMYKAFLFNARKIWVANVGDIKPAEYNIQLFLDMAYDIKAFTHPRDIWDHHKKWAETIAPGWGDEITKIFHDYYHLCFERRPEFMGWNQVEYKTVISRSEYEHWFYGDEAQKRLDAFQSLLIRVNLMKRRIPQERRDAFFELVEYPVKCAAWMNIKFLCLEKAYLYARQGRASASEMAVKARAAYDSIFYYTHYYNHDLAKGKWKGMMSMQPRNLPVFEMPLLPSWEIPDKKDFAICHEGFTNEAYLNNKDWPLPDFTYGLNDSAFIDVYLKGKRTVEWTAAVSKPWIRLSMRNGKLENTMGRREVRLWVTIDWKHVPDTPINQGVVTISEYNKIYHVLVSAHRIPEYGIPLKMQYYELNDVVSIWAEHCQRLSPEGWLILPGLGYTGNVLAVDNQMIDEAQKLIAPLVAEYDFFSKNSGKCCVRIHCLPVHPLNSIHELRLSVRIDTLDKTMLNYKTIGRSEQWKKNVLSNDYPLTADFILPASGHHTLRIRALDPCILIDRIEIDFGKVKKSYLAIPETGYGLQ
ncbi:glycosyl hydrolase 115 family protein [bacterium]|nr:glycosyl hydrolase 115 family protein [bacterium]